MRRVLTAYLSTKDSGVEPGNFIDARRYPSLCDLETATDHDEGLTSFLDDSLHKESFVEDSASAATAADTSAGMPTTTSVRISGKAWNHAQATFDATSHLANSGQSNAMRHCVWAGRMTRDFGERTVRGFLDRHERGQDLSDPAVCHDYVADLHNNEIGVARQVRHWA